ncbi:MAG: copper homeostasis protein CutC [Chitinophagaceae bacterium]
MSTKQPVNYILEVATTDYITTKEAIEAGADRIELTSALSEGGITPSYGILKLCIEHFNIPINVMIRPRGGDFLYTSEEIELMKRDIQLCKQMGFTGVVFGLLKTDGSMDKENMKMLTDIAYPLSVTCHRAFDRCRDPFKALEDIIEIGCERLLTSGQKETVPEGVSLIAELVKTADERITIMPGSGIRAINIREIAEKTGAREFHTSAPMKRKSEMSFIHSSFANSEEVYMNAAIDAEEMKAIKQALS